jgi:hypothetical protein
VICLIGQLLVYSFCLYIGGVASCFRNSIICLVAKVIAWMVDWFGGWVVALLVR